jgi:hypothetical protein
MEDSAQMNRRFHAFVLLAAGSALAAVSPQSVHQVERLRATFTNEVVKIDKGHAETVTVTRDRYSGALLLLEDRYKGAGALDPTLAVRKERARFAKSLALRQEHVVPEPAELLALQNQYVAMFAALPVERARKVIHLSQLYGRSLKTLEENLTRRADLESAVMVKDQREAIDQIPDVAAALFLVSNSESAPPPEVESKTEPSATVGGSDSPRTRPPPKTTSKKYTGPADGRIRSQFESLCRAARAEDWDEAMRFVDPAFKEEYGEQMVRPWLKWLNGVVSRADRRNVRLELREIEVAQDETSACSTPSARANNEWHGLQSVQWVLSDGDWFVDLRPLVRRGRGGDRLRKP